MTLPTYFRLIGRTTVFKTDPSYRHATCGDAIRGVTLDGRQQTVARLVDVVPLSRPGRAEEESC